MHQSSLEMIDILYINVFQVLLLESLNHKLHLHGIILETILADNATVSVSALPNVRLPDIVASPETVRLSDIETFPLKLAVLVAVVTDQTSPVYPSYDKAVSAIEPQSLARHSTACGSN